jgi:hypothetical protein
MGVGLLVRDARRLSIFAKGFGYERKRNLAKSGECAALGMAQSSFAQKRNMARKLGFIVNGEKIELELFKIERSKLYGSSYTKAFDENGKECQLMSLANDGKTLFGEGGSAIMLTNADGEVVSRETLTPIDTLGNRLERIESSFNAPIEKLEKATVEEYLSGIVKSVYSFPESEERQLLAGFLADEAILKFDFSYRGGVLADTCFLLKNNQGEPFIIVTNPAEINFVGFEDSVGLAEEIADEVELDELDFDMM